MGAIRLRLGGFLEVTDDDFEWAMQLNFFTALRATRAAIGPMVAQGHGAIVNVASVNAFYQPDGATIDYGAAKAAVVNLTKSLSQEFGPQGIRINAVSPGPVSTDLWLGEDGVAQTVGRALGVDADTARAQIVAGMGGIPSGRFTTPEEVATLVVLLASERNGQRHRRELRDRRRPHQDHVTPPRRALGRDAALQQDRNVAVSEGGHADRLPALRTLRVEHGDGVGLTLHGHGGLERGQREDEVLPVAHRAAAARESQRQQPSIGSNGSR